MYADYYRPPQVLHQRGHGLGSLFAKFALPVMRRLAPVAKNLVKKHGKKVVRTAVKAGAAALKNKNNRKKAAGDVFRNALATELAKPKKKKKPLKKQKGTQKRSIARKGPAQGLLRPDQRHLFVKPSMRGYK